MIASKIESELLNLIFGLIYIVTLVHVFLESKRMNDASIRNTLLVAVCVWPLGYALWIFYWPGTFWRKLTGRKRLEPSQPLNFNRMDKSDVYPAGGGSD